MTYSDLEINHFYLLIRIEGEEISLVQPIMETNECLLLQYHNEEQSTTWEKKSDVIFELIEELADDYIAEFENLFEYDEDDE